MNPLNHRAVYTVSLYMLFYPRHQAQTQAKMQRFRKACQIFSPSLFGLKIFPSVNLLPYHFSSLLCLQISLHFAANIHVDSVSFLALPSEVFTLGILTALCQDMG